MTRSLNDIMSFDHVIHVDEDGSITEPDGIYAPEVAQYEGDDGQRHLYLSPDTEWQLLDGYSQQYGYSGPVMHSSEFIGGGMERHIRETPGAYVAVVVSDLDDDEHPSGWAVAVRRPPVEVAECTAASKSVDSSAVLTRSRDCA